MMKAIYHDDPGNRQKFLSCTFDADADGWQYVSRAAPKR